MPRLSLIIPFLGNRSLLENTLVSVLEHRPENCEILVVLNEHYDDPYDLKDEVRFLPAPTHAPLVESIEMGVRASLAPLVHVLACGAEVADGWTEAACARFNDPQVATVVPLVLDLETRRKLLSAGLVYRPGGSVLAARRIALCEGHGLLAPHLAAAFYRKSAMETVGSLDAGLGDTFASVDLSLAFEQAGLKTVVDTDARVFLPGGWEALPTGFRFAREAEQLYWRWASYGGRLRSLIRHGLAIAGECGRNFPRPAMLTQLAGRLVGACPIGSRRTHYRRLRRARTPVESTAPAVAEPHFSIEACTAPAPRRLVG